MRERLRYITLLLPVILAVVWVIPAGAEVHVQCPCIRANATTGKPDPTRLWTSNAQVHPVPGSTLTVPAAWNPATQNIECAYTTGAGASLVTHNVACKFLTAGDGHIQMADGNDMFIFGFDEMTWDTVHNHGIPVDQMLNFATDPVAPGGKRGQESSAPTINMKEGQEFYLSLTNVTMYERPDLFDPHTVHYHGFPNAGSVFDGEPMASIAVPMGETLTYYYNNVEPGTYMYHCHVEAAEHMQMGMLGNLYVRPKQDGSSITYQGTPHTNFAYNDCPGTCSVTTTQACHTNADCPSPQVCNRPTLTNCGVTGYDIAYPMEIISMDPDFHHADNSYNELDFSGMDDRYALFNGRGYPDTVNSCTDGRQTSYPTAPYLFPACVSPIVNSLGLQSQNTTAAVYAKKGQKILLRMPSLDTTGFRTVTLLGLPMQVVGQGARQYKSATNPALTYDYNTSSVTLSGGEAYDILIDTSSAQAGTYFLYTTNLNGLSNDAQDYGGLMTEIVVNN